MRNYTLIEKLVVGTTILIAAYVLAQIVNCALVW